jgi:hypothetical protein
MKTIKQTVKATLFVLLTVTTMNACAGEEKNQAKATSSATSRAADKPAPRKGHRMQLEPLTADKFAFARKN